MSIRFARLLRVRASAPFSSKPASGLPARPRQQRPSKSPALPPSPGVHALVSAPQVTRAATRSGAKRGARTDDAVAIARAPFREAIRAEITDELRSAGSDSPELTAETCLEAERLILQR